MMGLSEGKSGISRFQRSLFLNTIVLGRWPRLLHFAPSDKAGLTLPPRLQDGYFFTAF